MIVALVVVRAVVDHAAGTSFGFGTWSQIAQATITAVNLGFVVYFSFRTLRERRFEHQLNVDSFWLQKVIVEPNTKRVDELYEGLDHLVMSANTQAQQMHEASAPGIQIDEAISSYADHCSQRLEKFRFQIVPLLSVVMDGKPTNKGVWGEASSEVNEVIDKVDESLAIGLTELFEKPGTRTVALQEALRSGRSALLDVLFRLHKRPFAPEALTKRKVAG